MKRRSKLILNAQLCPRKSSQWTIDRSGKSWFSIDHWDLPDPEFVAAHDPVTLLKSASQKKQRSQKKAHPHGVSFAQSLV